MAKSETNDLVLSENTKLFVVSKNDKISLETKRMIKLVRGMLICRIFNERGEKISKNDTYSKIYKITYKIRSSLGIPGGAGDSIPREFIKKYPHIPKYLLEKETKNERLEYMNSLLIKLKNISQLNELSQL